jgi:hypothetical protein
MNKNIINFMESTIQIIIVLYKTSLEDSLSFQTLQKNISCLRIKYRLLLYNNSPEIVIPQSENYIVVNATKNDMLLGAYNYALKQAVDNNCKWLLLLDQDTSLTIEYFEALNYVLPTTNAAAIIPKLKCGQKHLAPEMYSSTLGPWGILKDITKSGIIKDKTIAALNSSALLSIKALQSIGGFPNEFPLDMLDICVFYKLSKDKNEFYLLDVELQHDLSVLDYAGKMTHKRYNSIIDSEYKLAKQIGVCCFFVWKLRLFFRVGKQIITPVKRKYSLTTLRYFFKI